MQRREDNLWERSSQDRSGGWRVAPIIDWLLREGRLNPDTPKLIDALAERIIEAGAQLWRLRVIFRTIHPQVAVWGYTWVRGRGICVERYGHGIWGQEAYIGSPGQRANDTGEAVRCRLDRLAPDAHPVLHEVAAQGATDYLLMPMLFSDGTRNVFAVATDAPQGFSEADLEALAVLNDALSPVLEVAAARRIAEALLETYVGRRTGARVLRGLIKRGDGETIHAAVWYCDLRDFTPLTETLPAADLLATLNAYFETLASAVTPRGGEILRFIGDAMLIVFPVGLDGSVESACRSALDAALDAFAGVATLNHRRRRRGEPEIRFGVGLNVGEVFYGNVGAPDRLDFTVMGPAVNRTARLEALTRELGVPLLMSDSFAGRLNRRTRSLGFHQMKGVANEQEVFALEEENG